jgi:hypothetical protein
VHPGGNGYAHALFEGKTKGAVTLVAAFVGELLSCNEMTGGNGFAEITGTVL